MGTTTWTTSELKSIASKIQGQCDNMNASMSTIATLLEETKSAWSGADSTSFYTKANESYEGIKIIIQLMDGFPEFLNEVAANYENTESNFTNI